jgi:peptidoglycan-associated lipoprotein
MRRLAEAAVLGLALVLGGCATSPTADLPPSSAAPAAPALPAAPVAQTAPDSGGIGAEPGTEKDFMLNVGRRTFFKEGSAELDSTARVTIANQAQWLNKYPQWKVKLQGFADDPGSDAQQLALSQKRADAVRNHLVAQGVAPERVKAKGYGRDRLVGDCADIECKAQNRRVITNPQDAPDF